VRSSFLAVYLAVTAGPLAGQSDEPPSGLAAVEMERSRACVAILARVEEVNARLEPHALRSQRLGAIAQAIALEDRASVEPFDEADPAERRVREWFDADAALAQRFVNTRDSNVTAERGALRENIKRIVTEAVQEVQRQADEILQANADLPAAAAQCDGAIFVRGAVLEACATQDGPLCEQAALPASEVQGFRFVDDPESMWDIQELRPWTTPGPLRPSATGQLEGARTVGFARIGNVVVSVAFSPLIRDRAELSPEVLSAFQAVNDSLGIAGSHPDLAFTPALGVRAALPRPLAGEARYVIHFGTPEAPEVLWSGPADTGAPLEATVPLAAAHASRLRVGETVSLTALSGGPDGATGEPVFTIQMSNVSQAPAVDALLRYMASGLATDLTTLLRPREEIGR
jgi:hypothetical protein